MQAEKIRIGTRGSPLALAQAREIRRRLAEVHDLNEDDCELCVFKTAGDRLVDQPLSQVGGKGLFTKEIEHALLAGEIDLAVHSTKDMPTMLPAGLAIGATPKREDPRDAFISSRYASLDDLPCGTIVGTSSLRRQAQVLRQRPDLRVLPFRGNVETRLRKLEEKVADATFLACAGLNRLDLRQHIKQAMSPEAMLPAVAQGAICIEVRNGDAGTARLIAPLNDADTALCIAVERAYLTKLDGSCLTPIAGLAELSDGTLRFRGEILTPDGSQSHATERCGAPETAVRLGEEAAAELLNRAGPDFFRALA